MSDEGNDHGSDPIIGKTIDGCVVQRKLGQGGMGVVYLAEHETLKQEFVLKILNPALTGAEDTVDRFFREAQACAQLNHPGIVAIQNVGQEGEYYFIRMEYVEGETLEDRIRQENQLDWREATRMCIEVADALSHAHQKGMIHRDIKPENVMRTPDGAVKVMDFGLAKHVHSSAKVSVTGQIVGTPFFMSPEQAGGKPTDARSDIYSLGVTLYYLVTGVKPFNGKNLQEIFLKHFFYAPESPKIYNDALPESLCEIVKRCLKKKKKERYQSAKALVRDLQAILDDPNTPVGDAAPTAAAASAAGAPSAPDADRTVVAQAEEEGGATVRVEKDEADGRTVRVEAEGGGATVRVEEEGGGATVKVDRGGVGTVSFSKGGEDDGSTVRIDQDDEEPAHAGLDLPQSLLGDLEQEPSKEQAGPKRDVKKVVAIAAVVILIPLGLLGLFNSLAKSNFNALKAKYEQVKGKDDKDALRAMATQFRDFATTTLFAPGPAAEASDLAKKLEDRAAALEKDEQDKNRRDREAEDARAAEERRKKAEQEALAKINSALTNLTDALEAAERGEQEGAADGYQRWQKYVQLAQQTIAAYGKTKAAAAMLDRVKYPVFVTSDPDGAEVFLNGRATDQRTRARVMVTPNTEIKVRVHREGFVDEEAAKLVEGVVSLDFSLKRKELRDRIEFGTLNVTFGAGKVSEPIVPINAPVVVEAQGQQQEGVIYFVDQGGFLRAFSLKDHGRMRWPFDDKKHMVGSYGDPTPPITVISGRGVIVSSLHGWLSAHSDQSGDPIWPKPVHLDAPATSPPVFSTVLDILAVGTASGRVYFINQAGEVKGTFDTENPVVTAPYFWGDRFCLVGSTDNRVYCLDWRQAVPRELDRLDLGSDVIAGPIPIGGKLLVGTSAGQVHMLKVGPTGKLTDLKAVGESGSEPVRGIRVVGGDKFYFTVGSTLWGANSEGALRWKEPFRAAKPLTAPLAPTEGELVYVGCEDGTLYAIDKSTGDRRWSFTVPDAASHPIRFPPFIAGRELFVIAEDRIHVLAAD
ncbi:MAG: protein kinase [Planctomycetota bacterium]